MSCWANVSLASNSQQTETNYLVLNSEYDNSCFCSSRSDHGFQLLSDEVKLFAGYLVLVTRYLLLVACYFLLVARYLLLVARYFLLDARYFLLLARQKILKDFFLSKSKQKVLYIDLYRKFNL